MSSAAQTWNEPSRRRLRWAGKALFWIWAPLLLCVVASLMVSHWATLPKPARADRVVASALAQLRQTGDSGKWQAVHVLYSECRCSRRILRHLFERGPVSGVAETIVLVGSSTEYAEGAKRSGYRLVVVTPAELAEKYGFESAPLLAVGDPAGNVRYLGGFTDRKQGLEIRDLAIIQALQREEKTAELPLFGCAVSQSLQKLLDPLNLKYRGVR
jgi:hypothetical protein